MEDDLSGFEDQFAELDEDSLTKDDIVITEKTDIELMEIIYETNRTLNLHHQGLKPTEQWARDMHSRREAARLELSLRTR